MNRALAGLGIALALACRAGAEDAAEAEGDVITVTFTLKKDIQKTKDQLAAQRQANDRAAQAVTAPGVVFVEAAPRVEAKVREADAGEALVEAQLQRAEALLARIEKAPESPEARALLVEARQAADLGRMGAQSLRFQSIGLEQLKRVVDYSERGAGHPEEERGADLSGAAFGDEDGGGVYLDRAAELPFKREEVEAARYDRAQGRFVLRVAGRDVLLPPMDADLVAAAMRCVHHGGDRGLLAVSFEIDPVDKRRLRPSFPGQTRVLLGCESLWDTELGRILIDADDILGMVWNGRNRRGDKLTREHGYASLIQLSLDHPAADAVVKKVKFEDVKVGLRVWIRPKPLKAALAAGGGELSFEDPSFELLTETVRFDSPGSFAGRPVPNPGADVFAARFNEDFRRFEGLPLREEGGRVIRPFMDLKEAAKVAGTLLWLKGGPGEAAVALDTAWSLEHRPARARTARHLVVLSIEEPEADITPPFIIYGEHGPSRLIQADGAVFKARYDAAGRYLGLDPAGRWAPEARASR